MKSLSKTTKIILLFLLLLLTASCGFQEKNDDKVSIPEHIKKIRVVMDNNYPPFIFTDSKGAPQGILVEQWKLWEKKTGVEAEIMPLDWHDALETMRTGGAEVIDTIFFNEKRALIYDFTKPYAAIDVPIFFNKKISGIKDAETAKGFSIAVKKGDNAINVLKENGIESLLEFDSYEEIISKAKENRITVFVVDAPPAFYFLYKMGIQDEFNHTAPLYSGAFHRAVKKGDKEILDLVNLGFSRISKTEYEKIDTKWYGAKTIINKKALIYFASAFALFFLATVSLILWNRTLKKQVRIKTSALENEVEINLKKTEELVRSEEVLRSTIESMDDLIFIFDKNNCFTAFHQPSKNNELYLPQESFLTKHIEAVGLPTQAVKGYLDALERLKKSGKSQSYEYPMDILGEKKWYSARLSDRKDSNENFDGVTAVIRDITIQKNLESERERILANLEIKNIELEKIVYVASHDLRSPLLNIHGFSKRLEKALDDIFSIIDKSNIDEYGKETIKNIIEERVKNSLSYIISSVARMDTLINGLLRLSRSGGREPVKANVNMDSLIARVLTSMNSQIQTSGAEVKAESLPPCKADHDQLTQVFSNLLDNALKYRDENRHVEIFIRGREEDGMVVYSVSDTGRGIASADQKRIWEIFQRVESDEKIQGDGLGLAISKKIIERHGGSISLESIPGQGSSFFVRLEAADQRFIAADHILMGKEPH